jgi:uncharacterized protein (DUF2336 family)
MTTNDNATPSETLAPAPDDTGLASAAVEQHTLRELLVRKLIDIIVLPAARISANERSLTADILLQIAGKVEDSLRTEIARRVARVPDAPPALLRMLLLDEPAVAGAIIQGAAHIPESLLIETAVRATTAHRDMIARRLDLTTSVADAMLKYHEPDIARLLLRREEFAFSPTAIDILVSRSTDDRELQALLLRRRELEPAHGFMMFWWVDGERRKRILSRFALDRSILQETVQELYPPTFGPGATPDPVVKEILTLLDRRHRARAPSGEALTMDMVKKTLALAWAAFSHDGAVAVSALAGVSLELAARILRDPGGEPFAVMCKSLGVARNDFFKILTIGEDAAAVERAEELLAVFDMMARDFARAVLRYWDWDGNPRIARITRLVAEEGRDHKLELGSYDTSARLQ